MKVVPANRRATYQGPTWFDRPRLYPNPAGTGIKFEKVAAQFAELSVAVPGRCMSGSCGIVVPGKTIANT